MRALILTHPLIGNYGGMLQAFALQCTCASVNIDAKVLSFNPRPKQTLGQQMKKMVATVILYLLPVNLHFNCLNRNVIAKRFQNAFVRIEDIHDIEPVKPIIVGSDQVWRREYVKSSLRFFFLNYISCEHRNNCISYAASFGSDEWEGTTEETKECGRLLREFKAVSVREHSGVKICKEVFGVDAVQMPDPTFLLYINDYDKIINSEKTWLPKSKYVAAYVLDETAGKAELLQEGASALNLHLQQLMPHANAKKRRDRFPISVPQWLRLIRDCEYFITDSFHGCVFAIIYNKPFVCLGNEGRGNARFDTLLGTFGLEDRLITDATSEKLLQVLNTPIDWERVNAIHDSERERGINFLKENLSES